MIVLVLGVTACKGAHEAPAPAPAPHRAAAQPTQDYWALLTAARVPSLVGPFAALHLDPRLTIAEAQRQAPELFARVSHALEWFEDRSEAFGGVTFYVERVGQVDTDPGTWLVGRLRVVAPPGLAQKLAAAWGPPRTAGEHAFWYDPAHDLRADLHQGRVGATSELVLDLQGYTPLATFIGTDPKLFGFEQGQAILGASSRDVQRRFGRRVFDYSRILLWPTELDAQDAEAKFADFGDELVDADDPPFVIGGFTVDVPDGERDQLQQLLATKLGKPKPGADEGVLVYRSRSPRVVLQDDELQVGALPQ